MINPKRPLEFVNQGGLATTVRMLMTSGNVIWIIEDDIRDGMRAMAFTLSTGQRCNDQGIVSESVGNITLRNRTRTVYVNFYIDGSAYYYDNAVTAGKARTTDLIAGPIAVQLPL